MAERVVNNISDFMGVMLQVLDHFERSRAWWRGHSDATWELTPSVYRSGRSPKEFSFANKFRTEAPVRMAKPTPADDELESWLFLMQHYGVPTRLLDWSYSPLTALYFAVHDTARYSQPGCLWALYPGKLNKRQTGHHRIYTGGSATVKPIIRCAFSSECTEESKRIVAITPPKHDLRQLVQLGASTMHGLSDPLESLKYGDEILLKFEIPADAKPVLDAALKMFGISRSTVFPDLESLAKDIAEENFAMPEFGE